MCKCELDVTTFSTFMLIQLWAVRLEIRQLTFLILCRSCSSVHCVCITNMPTNSVSEESIVMHQNVY